MSIMDKTKQKERESFRSSIYHTIRYPVKVYHMHNNINSYFSGGLHNNEK